jgi:uncharacterized protein YkwD
MQYQLAKSGFHWLITLGLLVTVSACGGGAATPPAAQAQASEQSGSDAETDANVPAEITTPSGVPLTQTGDATETPSTEVSTPDANEAPAVVVDLSDPVLCTTDQQRFEEVLLARINAARAESRLCGNESYPSVPALIWNSKLESAAEAHSLDMSDHNFFSHTGSDGSDVAMRAQAQSYEWRAIGENIAAGQNTAEEVIEGWLESPGHCRNLMNENYTEVAVACVQNVNTDYHNYWTNVLGNPFR